MKRYSFELDTMKFAAMLAQWRVKKGITQNELAKKWNVSRFTIIRAEKGEHIGWRMALKLYAHLTEESIIV